MELLLLPNELLYKIFIKCENNDLLKLIKTNNDINKLKLKIYIIPYGIKNYFCDMKNIIHFENFIKDNYYTIRLNSYKRWSFILIFILL